MKDQLEKHLKDNNFVIQVEDDGDGHLINLMDDKTGKTATTFVFDGQGNLQDVWNGYKDEVDDLKKELEDQKENAKLGEAIQVLAKLFK